jgi:hypothetical protein
MGSPNLCCLLLLGSVAVSAALNCYLAEKFNGEKVIQRVPAGAYCVRMRVNCGACSEYAQCANSSICTTEDMSAHRTLTKLFATDESQYLHYLDSCHCSRDPNERLSCPTVVEFASCETDLCNTFESRMNTPFCDMPVDPKFADFYCINGTWASDASIHSNPRNKILYPPSHDFSCFSALVTEKRTGKTSWMAGYELNKRWQKYICKDNVFEDDDAIFRSLRLCKWSGCNSGKNGDLVTCPNATQVS